MAKARHARPSKMRTVTTRAAAAAPVGVASLAIAAPAYAATPGQIQQANQIVPVPVPAIVRVLRTPDPLYTVAPGNSLSGIAQKRCGTPSDWTGIYEANKHQISDPDDIYPGEHLALDCRQVRGVTDPDSVPPPVQAIVTDHASYSGYSSGGGNSSGGSYGNVTPGGYSGIESCIISRESGGQSQVMNASGHYGLFQFDIGTWESGGGNPGDFGHASVAEQQRVFDAVYAARGAEPWAPSDGC
jgi:LysM repeat protein